MATIEYDGDSFVAKFSSRIYDSHADDLDEYFDNYEKWVKENLNLLKNEANNPRLTELHSKIGGTPIQLDKRKRNPLIETPLATCDRGGGRRKKKPRARPSFQKNINKSDNQGKTNETIRSTRTRSNQSKQLSKEIPIESSSYDSVVNQSLNFENLNLQTKNETEKENLNGKNYSQMIVDPKLSSETVVPVETMQVVEEVKETNTFNIIEDNFNDKPYCQMIMNDPKLSSEAVVIVETMEVVEKFNEITISNKIEDEIYIENKSDIDKQYEDFKTPEKSKGHIMDEIFNSPEVLTLSTPITENKSGIKNEGKNIDEDWITDDESLHESPPVTNLKNVISKQKLIKPIKKENIRVSINKESIKNNKSRIPLSNDYTPNQKRLDKPSQSSVLTRKMSQKIISSGGSVTSIDSANNRLGSSVNPEKAKNRIKTPSSSNKNLTESAIKRKEQEIKLRMVYLQQLEEKSSKVNENKEEFLKRRVLEQKQRREQKERRAAQLREEQERDKKQKILDELRKKEEVEQKKKEREEAKRREAERRQQMHVHKQLEAEQRKIQEEKERQLKLEEKTQKKLELERLKMEDKERQDKLNELIQNHNSSLQKKAIANSLLKKNVSSTLLNNEPSNVDTKPPNFKDPIINKLNSTYGVEKSSQKNVNSYDITPPPKPVKKPPAPSNYDISDMHSDGDTDDESAPRKPVPEWAKGALFVSALKEQYNKPLKERNRMIDNIFPSVKMPVDLGDIFQGHVPVISKYERRTSSAVWDMSPSRLYNLSMNTSKSGDSHF